MLIWGRLSPISPTGLLKRTPQTPAYNPQVVERTTQLDDMGRRNWNLSDVSYCQYFWQARNTWILERAFSSILDMVLLPLILTLAHMSHGAY